MYYNMKAHVVPLFFNFFCVVNSVFGITVAVHQNANLNSSHPTMQDAYVAEKYGAGKQLWGVYDGHGSNNDSGAFCAWKVAEDIAFCVPRFGWDARRVAERYVELDEEFAAEPRGPGREGGTTATTVLFDGINKLDIIHAGDCRVLIGNTEAYGNLTRDHSLLDPAELRRVIAADVGESFLDIDYTWDYMRRFAENRGLIKCCGQDGSGRWYAPRLCLNGAGDLNVVRTVGDRRHKNRAVATAVPDITSYTLTPDSEFLAIVSDGITEAMNSAQIATIISNVMRDESVTDSEKAKIAAKTVVGWQCCCCLRSRKRKDKERKSSQPCRKSSGMNFSSESLIVHGGRLFPNVYSNALAGNAIQITGSKSLGHSSLPSTGNVIALACACCVIPACLVSLVQNDWIPDFTGMTR